MFSNVKHFMSNLMRMPREDRWPVVANRGVFLGYIYVTLEILRFTREVLGDVVAWMRWLRTFLQ